MALSDSTISKLDGQADSAPSAQAITIGPKLTSLVPILQKLNTSLVFENGKYYIPSNLTTERWTELRDHAGTVEELTISNAEGTIADITYVQWARRQGCEVLFSKIKKLHVTYEPKPSSFDISLFLSPSLSVLHIDRPSDEAQMQLSFALIQSPLLNLTRLTIQNLKPSSRLLNAISSCQLLDSLELGVTSGKLDFRQVQALLALPFLQSLKVSLESAVAYEQEPPDELRGPHGELRHHNLSVQAAGPPDFIIDVLRAAQYNRCCLASVSLDWKIWDVNNETMSEILQLCPQNIHELRLHGPGSVDFSESIVSQQITKFHDLKTLIFPTSAALAQPYQWDAQLKSYLPLWSALEELALPFGGSPAYATPETCISFESLKSIAEACPSLHTLRAFVQHPTSFEHPTEFSTTILTHQLRNLTIASGYKRYQQTQTISTALAFSIARYIYALFPKIENIESSEDAWKAIAETVLLLKNVCNDAYVLYEKETQKMKAGAAH